MTCLNCNAEAIELSRELIPAAEYTPEYEIKTEARVSVKYECPVCHIKFWVWVEPKKDE
jgi:uncharacterized protein with PIN domain